LLAAYDAWKKVYEELADGFGANAKAKPDWSPVEQDMLGVIQPEKLLAIERATVDTARAEVGRRDIGDEQGGR
jgi:hypothetical protein